MCNILHGFMLAGILTAKTRDTKIIEKLLSVFGLCGFLKRSYDSRSSPDRCSSCAEIRHSAGWPCRLWLRKNNSSCQQSARRCPRRERRVQFLRLRINPQNSEVYLLTQLHEIFGRSTRFPITLRYYTSPQGYLRVRRTRRAWQSCDFAFTTSPVMLVDETLPRVRLKVFDGERQTTLSASIEVMTSSISCPFFKTSPDLDAFGP